MSDHLHHHHHHKRSAEEDVDYVKLDPEILDQLIKKKPPTNFPKKERRPSGIAVAAVLGTVDRLFKTTLKYCKQYGQCSSSLLPNVSETEKENLNQEWNLAIYEHFHPLTNLYEFKKELEDNVHFKVILRHIFSQYFNINEDAILAFLFDDKFFIEYDSHKHHKRSVEESTIPETVQDRSGKNLQIEKRRQRSYDSFLLMLFHRILMYCKYYESCSSSIYANVSKSDREIINREMCVAALKHQIPTTDVLDLKKYFDDSKPLKDIFREDFAAVFNISEDAFLSYFFDDKPFSFIRKKSAKHAKPLKILFEKKSV